MFKENPTKQYSLLSLFVNHMLRLFFHLLYHSFAWAYDLVASTVSIGRWKRWVTAIDNLVSGERILELGYGPGHLQTHLASSGLAVFGLDESRQMARQAARRLVRHGFSPRLVRGMAQGLPFPGGSFDCVVATFPTLYIVNPQTLSEVLRVLQPGGHLIVLMAGWITGKSLPDRLMNFVFRVTGQVPHPEQELSKFTQPYQEAGFHTRLYFIEQPGSRLLVILAKKKESGDFGKTLKVT